MNRQKSILAVGAHVGDMELTSGGLLATCSRLGWKVVLVTLTSSERSAPEGMDLKQVKQTKVKEAAAFARVLGAESIVLDIPDGFLKPSRKVSFLLRDLICRNTPEIVVTHYASPHKDHMACHTIVNHAVFYASLPNSRRGDLPHSVPHLLYAENWEDNEDFKKELYIDTSEGYALWQDALQKETSVLQCPFLPIVEYYTVKSRLNGILAHTGHAECYARAAGHRTVRQVSPVAREGAFQTMPTLLSQP